MNLNPVGPGGTFGEILCHVHDSSHEPGVATSYGAWLEAIAAKLETGRFSIDKYGYLQPDIE
jgi:cell wall assembly regulator SMI1